MFMKAVVCLEYGPPEVQKIMDLEKPKPEHDEILVKVHATTVNRTDTGLRSAHYVVSRLFTGLIKPKIKVFGTEFAGEVVKIGSSVRGFKKGDKVFGFDDTNFGCHAEYKVIKASGCVTKMPKGYSYQKATAISEGAQYALNNIRYAGVKKDQNVLIYGASGAIGSASVQICKARGARVTAVVGTANLKLMKELGADKVVDYQKTDFTETDEKYDFVFDAVGKTSYGVCKKIMKKDGVYCSTELGKGLQNPLLALGFFVIRKKRVIFPIPKATKEKLDYLVELINSGQYEPVIDKVYKFEEIVEATKYVETGQKVGNVVLQY